MVKQVYNKLKHIHMVGIGGTGMNGIAEVLLNLGYQITGTDIAENQAVKRLKRLGARITIGHSAERVEGADVIVISSAVSRNNVEVQEARRLKIPVIPRAEMLAELMRMKYGIAVAGSHGKTSTTSMIASILEKAGLDPTIIVGGRLNKVGAHGKLGEGDFIVAEADESDRSFLYLAPFIAILTNLDKEHLDQYGDVEEIKKTFVNFANKVPFFCPVVLCLDDANLQSLIPKLERRLITYGFSTQAEVVARNPKFHEFSSASELFWKGESLGTLKLNVPGMHSIYNAMAAAGVGLDLEIPVATIFKALEEYDGIGRRFELKDTVNGSMVFEDYAHHPTEIKTTLDAAKRGWSRRTLAVFQPHRYSRLSSLMKEFGTAFNQSDIVIITDIYPAGEEPIPGISGRALYEEILQHGHKGVYFVPDLQDVPDKVAELQENGDMILVLGAGNVNSTIPGIIKKLKRT
ncbi:MAG: UDP-N-acetylmuramate--L-alanine ligase [Acidobacteria bacterium]|nr:UDP-N-acetylmuramate--L-alanine ligase [Acidobacteriota bacterium]MBU4254715.1 UDP-N-acetylmuramate--L-alanine ligase [Acidobacteriota bacterium]MBU4331205.1 UDP-N-acetylmuramate--L-alanine ligase [Acidobacteriota bacterium]MBU4493829.1 UDP-N-acetylmuramate--L-alanine ligase [Acidobacteriota bacterium]